MIVFYGEFSEESKKYLLKDNAFIGTATLYGLKAAT